MSESVERRVLEMLDRPTVSPFGNPIPGLDALMPDGAPHVVDPGSWVSLESIAREETARVTVRRIGESAQADPEVLAQLRRAGVVPGAAVRVQRAATGVMVGSAGEYVELPVSVSAHIAVEPLG